MKPSLILSVCLLIAACGQSNTPPPLTDVIDPASVSGKWQVINYWAIWCQPCREEIPELNLLAFQQKDIVVMGVNYDGITGEKLKKQSDEIGIRFKVLEGDPAHQLGVTRPSVLPTTFIINPQGELVHTLLGPQTLESLLAATIGLE